MWMSRTRARAIERKPAEPRAVSQATSVVYGRPESELDNGPAKSS